MCVCAVVLTTTNHCLFCFLLVVVDGFVLCVIDPFGIEETEHIMCVCYV